MARGRTACDRGAHGSPERGGNRRPRRAASGSPGKPGRGPFAEPPGDALADAAPPGPGVPRESNREPSQLGSCGGAWGLRGSAPSPSAHPSPGGRGRGAPMHDLPTHPPRLGRREVLAALVAALVLFAWPLRDGLVNPDRVVFGVDVATAQLPWSAVIRDDPTAAPDAGALAGPRNPDLSDQAVCFYPYYRWVARSWLEGDPPLWNPLVYTGAPGIANPQSGALDPQVWILVLLEKLGGRALFDWGFALVAWLRLAAAGMGAYLLARVLGLARAPAALAAVGFGLSGYVVLWLNHSLGHVTPCLPWILLGLEGTRGRRPLLAAAGAALALGLAILGGHPETAFYVGFAAGLWALAILREDRRAGALGLLALGLGTVLAGASLVPFVEYLELSGAKAIRDHGLEILRPDLLALGVVAVSLGLVGWYARLGLGREPLGRQVILAGVGLALAVGGSVLLLRARGLDVAAALALVPDLFGAPGDGTGGWRGTASYLERASGWVPFAALALALAAALSADGPLRRRRLVIPVGAVAFLLCLETPGLLDAYRHVPLVGLGATQRFGAVSSLFIALLAAEGLQAAPRAARLAAGMTLALLVLGALREPEIEVPTGATRTGSAVAGEVAGELAGGDAGFDQAEGELFGMVLAPEEELGESPRLEGWLHPGVAITSGVVRVQRLGADGAPDPASCFDVPLELTPEPSGAARSLAAAAVGSAPEGATWFRASYLVPGHLDEGVWRFAVDFFGDDPSRDPATRIVAHSTVRRPRSRNPWTLAGIGASLLLLVLLPARGTGSAGGVLVVGTVGLVLVQGLGFARGIHPAIPRNESFPPTATEEVLAEILGPYRWFSEPHVMPPDTGLVRGLRGLDGYDGMDVARYNAYRGAALLPGMNPLLGWHARGVRLEGPAFRLLGVGALVLRDPLDHPQWELVAGPGQAREAEVWIYRAREPLPRAFVAGTVVTNTELGQLVAAGAWDPLAVASVEVDWRPEVPATQSEVSEPTWTNNTVRLEVSLDGDGLLVLTDQFFPGWEVEVDGVPGEVVVANGTFRGVPLGAGRHGVVFTYRPWTVRAGTWLSVAGLVVLVSFAAIGLVRRPSFP